MADEQGKRPEPTKHDDPAPGLDDIRWAESESGDPTESITIIETGAGAPLKLGADDTGPLPHWTDPPTGEVPKILLDDGSSDDLAAWTSLSANAPVWRDERNTGPVSDDDIDFGGLAEGTRVGALRERSTPADPFFDDDDDDLAPVRSGAATEEEAAGTRVTPIRTRNTPPRRAARTSRGDEPGFTPSRGTGGRNMPVAIGIGVAIAAVALFVFKLGPAATMALVVAVVVLAAVELYEKLRERGYQPATLAGLTAVGSLPLAAYWRGEAGIPVVLFLSVIAVVVWFILSQGLESGPLPNTAVTLFGVLYVGLLGSYAALILGMRDGVSILLVLTLGVVAYDVGGLFVGSAAGRTQLVAWISPNKTIEGLLGGCLAVVLVTILTNFAGISPFSTSLGRTLQVAAVIVVTAPIGDLAASMFKRNLDVKDFGGVLPGHGGVLDRFCSFLFVLPAVYYLAVLLDLRNAVG